MAAALRIEPVAGADLADVDGRLVIPSGGATVDDETVRALRVLRPAVSSQRPDVLVDTSVAVALVVADHEHHASVLDPLGGLRLGFAGHAAFETFSVLTRLPPPARRSPAVVHRLLTHNFPASRFLPADAAQRLQAELAAVGVAGGAVYDALVGAAARSHGLPLATRDQRALTTYRTLGVEVRIVA